MQVESITECSGAFCNILTCTKRFSDKAGLENIFWCHVLSDRLRQILLGFEGLVHTFRLHRGATYDKYRRTKVAE